MNMVTAQTFSQLVDCFISAAEQKEGFRIGARDVLELRYAESKTLELVGKDFGVTRERIRQIESQAIQTIANFEKNLIEDNHYPAASGAIFPIKSAIVDALNELGGAGRIDYVSTQLGCDVKQLLLAIRLIEKVEQKITTFSVTPKEKAISFGVDLKKGIFFLNDIPGHLKVANQILKAKKIMRFEDLFSAISEKIPAFQKRDLSDLIGLKLIKIIEAPICEGDSSYEEMNSSFGIWVHADISEPTREICRAIIYGLEQTDLVNDEIEEHFINGVRSDKLALWMDRYSQHKTTARNISSICVRATEVFVLTGPECWGLKNAGALEKTSSHISPEGLIARIVENLASNDSMVPFHVEEINRAVISDALEEFLSPITVAKYIDQMICDGYLENISETTEGKGKYNYRLKNPLPEEKRMEGPIENNNSGSGTKKITKLIKDILFRNPQGLSENKLLSLVRDEIPSASSISVHIYLTQHLKYEIEKNSGRYKLIEQWGDTEQEEDITTISVIQSVMQSSELPLTADDIYKLCIQIKKVEFSAVKSYLAQDYRGLFAKTKDGKWVLKKATRSELPDSIFVD